MTSAKTMFLNKATFGGARLAEFGRMLFNPVLTSLVELLQAINKMLFLNHLALCMVGHTVCP